MELQLKNQFFLVGGAGSGFGRAVAEALAHEGAHVLAVSRTAEKLSSLQKTNSAKIDVIAADLTNDHTHDLILKHFKDKKLSGAFINAGGPPAGNFFDAGMDAWDEAWKNVVRWKIALTKKLLPLLQANQYGRLLYLESVSVKQAVPNLILSNALRPAIVGMVKTLAQEVAREGITLNIMAPGYHSTAAMERLFVKKSEMENISIEKARAVFESEIPVGGMGKPEELASLALWLLSPLSRFVTGQIIDHAGGMVKAMV
jgi:3-oxoacyl-[acyl-carrier protein] reductase